MCSTWDCPWRALGGPECNNLDSLDMLHCFCMITLFSELHWLSVGFWKQLKVLVIIYKIINGFFFLQGTTYLWLFLPTQCDQGEWICSMSYWLSNIIMWETESVGGFWNDTHSDIQMAPILMAFRKMGYSSRRWIEWRLSPCWMMCVWLYCMLFWEPLMISFCVLYFFYF